MQGNRITSTTTFMYKDIILIVLLKSLVECDRDEQCILSFIYLLLNL